MNPVFATVDFQRNDSVEFWTIIDYLLKDVKILSPTQISSWIGLSFQECQKFRLEIICW
jgi:hypothetical protein